MTVLEYEGRIVVVDTGLRFPTPDQLGVDLVLPDFAYLRERAETSRRSCSPTGTRTTWARCRSCCASSTHRPPIYGGPLTIAMVRSKLDEHKLKNVELEEVGRATRSSAARSRSSR